jgi:hypothetical protein
MTARLPLVIAGTTIEEIQTGDTYNLANGASLPLSTGVSGTLPTANGGTNLTTFTSGGAVYASSTSVLTTGTLPIASGGTGATTLAGANIALINTAQTFTAKQTFSNSTGGSSKFPNILETATVSATAATGTINYDTITQSVLYYTTNASANFTINIRGDGTTSLNTLMATGEALTLTFLCTNGSTAYYNSLVQIDGSTVTPKWQGGAPTSGNASAVDIYNYAIIKTGSATYTVFASQTKFS